MNDLDISEDGTIMLSKYDGTVYFTDQEFSSFHTVSGMPSKAFGTFVDVPEPAVISPLLLGLMTLLSRRAPRASAR